MEYLERIYNYYLTKKQVEKLIILKKLFLRRRVSLKHFCEENNKNVFQMKNILSEIEEDVHSCTSQKENIFNIGKKDIYLVNNAGEENHLDLFVKLRKTYFNESPYYKVLIYMFKHREARVVEISNHLLFSVSYCYKIINYLKEMLNVQNVPISIERKSAFIEIRGAEMCIRMYHYLFEIMASNVYVETTVRSNIKLIAKEHKLLKTTKVKHNLILSIIENSLIKGRIVENNDLSSVEIFNYVIGFYDKVKISNFFSLKEEVNNNIEIMYYFFWSSLFIPEIITDDERIIIGEKLNSVDVKSNNILIFSKKIINRMQEIYKLDPQITNKISFEIVVNTWGYLNLFLDKFFSTEYLSSYLDSVKELERIVETSLDEVSTININKPDLFIKKIAQILASYIPLDKTECITIGLSTLSHPEYISVVKNTLSKIYNNDILMFTENLEDADILVSDGVLDKNKEQSFVFLGDIHNRKDWKYLNQVIQSWIINKCI